MIVEINDAWSVNPTEAEKAFFKAFGKYEEKDCTKEGEEPRSNVRYDLKYIGHIETVPISILNNSSYTKEYYKGMHALTDKLCSEGNFVKAQEKSIGVVNIHIPSPELLALNEVTWIENECTERVQSLLDEDWRIIACLPQVGNRRPDYILGRRKKEITCQKEDPFA